MGDIYTPREMLAKLVSFPTVSRDSNLPLIDFVEDSRRGIASFGPPEREANDTDAHLR